MKNLFTALFICVSILPVYSQDDLLATLDAPEHLEIQPKLESNQALKNHHTAIATKSLIQFVSMYCQYPDLLEEIQKEGRVTLVFEISPNALIDTIRFKHQHDAVLFDQVINQLNVNQKIDLPMTNYYGAKEVEINLDFKLK